MTSNHSNDALVHALRELAGGATGHDNDSLVPPGQRPCPICSAAMETLVQFGITIDMCEEHGVWLDQGELATLLERAYRHRREAEAAPPSRGTGVMDKTRSRMAQSMQRVLFHLRM